MDAMAMIGHPEVTRRAYAQSHELREEAMRFATSTIHNAVLNAKLEITSWQKTALMAQVERDYLVSKLPLSKGAACS